MGDGMSRKAFFRWNFALQDEFKGHWSEGKAPFKTLGKALLFVLSALILFTSSLPAREPVKIRTTEYEIGGKDHPPRLLPPASHILAQTVEPQPLDIEHYRLQLSLFPDAGEIVGTVTISGKTTAPTRTIKVDLYDNLPVDSLVVNGTPLEFTRSENKIQLNLPSALSTGESFTITVSYHGKPRVVGRLQSGMSFGNHAGFPIVATLSEPYGSPTWWPCIDNPADKTTAALELTVPNGYVATSNGVLEGVRLNADSSLTYFWREHYPIANYLIAVTATNFVEFNESYVALDGATSMPLVYYVYPEHLSRARSKFAVTKDAMRIYAELFGEYPFLKEKYGMVEFSWGGAMEHQTLTSLGESVVGGLGSGLITIVHELAHQWWGDWVTMRTWNDIWLNEGFATYCEVLFQEKYYGLPPGQLIQRYDDGRADGILRGTVYAENASDPWDDYRAIYNKGGWVLHMLRHVMGDEAFFAALREYGRRFAYSNASTEDFQKVCSEIYRQQQNSCSEFYCQQLDWFFQQWIYAPLRPIYSYSTTISASDGGAYTIRIRLEQKQMHAIPGRDPALQRVYIMPIDFTIHSADGTSEVRKVWNTAREQ